jgi:hypothetical protein
MAGKDPNPILFHGRLDMDNPIVRATLARRPLPKGLLGLAALFLIPILPVPAAPQGGFRAGAPAFRAGAAMATERFSHSATLLDNGWVLLAGGVAAQGRAGQRGGL